MESTLFLLLVSAASIGFFHTIMGPDHYFPFIVMSRSGQWSSTKTIWVTILCGFGHVLSSVLLVVRDDLGDRRILEQGRVVRVDEIDVLRNIELE